MYSVQSQITLDGEQGCFRRFDAAKVQKEEQSAALRSAVQLPVSSGSAETILESY